MKLPQCLHRLLFSFSLCCLAGCAVHRELPQGAEDGLSPGAPPISAPAGSATPPSGTVRGEVPPLDGDHGEPTAGLGLAGLPRRIGDTLESIAPLAAPGDQIVYLDPGSAPLSRGIVYAVQRTASGWNLGLAPLQANLGRNGVAPPWEKREGDGRTPSGLFELRRSFGYAPVAPGRIPYRQLGPEDLWVDDPQSPDYNLWVRRGATAASSFEQLLRPDPLYSVALVLEYNGAPVVRDLGSAIFLHLERSQDAPTSGCASLAEADLQRLMQWLDPARHPRMLVGTPDGVEALAAGVNSRLPSGMPTELRQRLQGGARVLALRRGKSGGYFGVAVTLPPEVERQLLAKKTWRPGCPVAPSELAYLVVAFWGFDGRPHYGELVAHASLSAFLVDSLQSAYNARFPIEKMELIEAFDADDERSMAANNSSGFNCREVPGKPGVFSRHSFGAALDLNPAQNPYLQIDDAPLRARGWNGSGARSEFLATIGFSGPAGAGDFCSKNPADCLVHPPGSMGYLERRGNRAGMLQPGDPVLAAFARRGWVWGGSWGIPDYQHLDYDVRKLISP